MPLISIGQARNLSLTGKFFLAHRIFRYIRTWERGSAAREVILFRRPGSIVLVPSFQSEIMQIFNNFHVDQRVEYIRHFSVAQLGAPTQGQAGAAARPPPAPGPAFLSHVSIASEREFHLS